MARKGPCDPRALLWDMDQAASAIGDFVKDVDEASHAASALVHSAVERKFEIISEALSQLAHSHPVLAARIPQFAQGIAFRNQLIHG